MNDTDELMIDKSVIVFGHLLKMDGKTLVEDKIILMMHVESTSSSIYLLISRIGMITIDCFIHSSLFYTFRTFDGHFLSLSRNHSIAIFNIQSNKTFSIFASKVTSKHHLVMPTHTVEINSFLSGVYSPLTLTGNLLFNNISTSVYFNRLIKTSQLNTKRFFFFFFLLSYGVPPEILHEVFTPNRIYYRRMRCLFGND
jgi:hypothetical protein